MVYVSASAAFAAGLILGLLALVVWRQVRRLNVQLCELRGRLAALEQERSSWPALRMSFEYRSDTREALLHVTNDGGAAEVWVPMSIEGPLAQQVDGDVYGAWAPGAAATVELRHGQTRKLRLAQLDLSVFPYAQWEIYGAGNDGAPFAVRAMHTSTIGGDPETHAPVLFLQLAVVSSPEPPQQGPQCTIALQPFEAVRLRAI